MVLFWHRIVQLSLFSVIFLGAFFDQKSWTIVSLFFFSPLLITLFRNTEYYSIKLKSKDKYIAYPLILLNIIISFFFTSGYDFLPNQNFYSYSFSIGQSVGFIALLLLVFSKKEKFKGTSKLYLIYIIITLSISNIILFKNYPSQKHAYDHIQVIKDKSIYNSRGPHYNLKFDKNDIYTHLSISQSEYEQLSIEDSVIFKLRHGKMGYDTYHGYEITQTIAP